MTFREGPGRLGSFSADNPHGMGSYQAGDRHSAAAPVLGPAPAILQPTWAPWERHPHNPLFTKCSLRAGAGHTGMTAFAREIGSLGVTGCLQHCTGG